MMDRQDPAILSLAQTAYFWNLVPFHVRTVHKFAGLEIFVSGTNIKLIAPLCLTTFAAEKFAAF